MEKQVLTCQYGLMKGKKIHLSQEERDTFKTWKEQAKLAEEKAQKHRKTQLLMLRERISQTEKRINQKRNPPSPDCCHDNAERDVNSNVLENSFQSTNLFPMSLDSVEFKQLKTTGSAPERLLSRKNNNFQESNENQHIKNQINFQQTNSPVVTEYRQHIQQQSPVEHSKSKAELPGNNSNSFNDTINDCADLSLVLDSEIQNTHADVGIVPEVAEQINALHGLQAKQRELDVWHDKMQKQLQLEQMKLQERYNEMRLSNIHEQQELVENSREFLSHSLRNSPMPSKSTRPLMPVLSESTLATREYSPQGMRNIRDTSPTPFSPQKSPNYTKNKSVTETDRNTLNCVTKDLQNQRKIISETPNNSKCPMTTRPMSNASIRSATSPKVLRTPPRHSFNHAESEGETNNHHMSNSRIYTPQEYLHFDDISLNRNTETEKEEEKLNLHSFTNDDRPPVAIMAHVNASNRLIAEKDNTPFVDQEKRITPTIVNPTNNVLHYNGSVDTTTASMTDGFFSASATENFHRRKSRPIRFFNTPEKSEERYLSVGSPDVFREAGGHTGSTSTPQTNGVQDSSHAHNAHLSVHDTSRQNNISTYEQNVSTSGHNCSKSGIPLSTSRFGSPHSKLRGNVLYSQLNYKYADKIVGLAKGFLTRRLMKTTKVLEIVTTIRDTRAFLEGMNKENKPVNHADKQMLHRLNGELASKREKLNEIFFVWPPTERMKLLSWTRLQAQEKFIANNSPYLNRNTPLSPSVGKKLSTASQRSIQRRKLNEQRPETAPANLTKPTKQNSTNSERALKPIQSGASPILSRPKTASAINISSSSKQTGVNKKLNMGSSSAHPKRVVAAEFRGSRASKVT